MNRFLIWITGMIIGAAAGYVISFVTGLNLFLCLGIGIILGSSIGITINMQRRKYRDFQGSSAMLDESDNEKPEVEEETGTQRPENQNTPSSSTS